MKMLRWCVLMLAFSYYSDASAQVTKLKSFSWMLGAWQMKTDKGILYEAWQPLNDSTYNGRSYKVKPSGDTTWLESVQIKYSGKKFYYVPTVPDQNTQQPVPFLMTIIRRNEFIAENPEHDFPQRISYKRSGDKLEAWIDGKVNGKYAKEMYSFVRR